MLFVLCCLQGFGQKKRIVFVCEHGAAKSVIAASYFNKLAKENNLEWEAVSRATVPDSSLTEGTRRGLKADQIYDSKRIPQTVSHTDTVGTEKIVLFTKLPPDFKTDVEIQDWSGIPNIDADYPRRRDAIVERLKILLSTLK